MLLREDTRPSELLFAASVGVLSFLAAVVFAAAFVSLVACSKPRPACTVPPRPAIHCPDLLLLVYRDCQWRCE